MKIYNLNGSIYFKRFEPDGTHFKGHRMYDSIFASDIGYLFYKSIVSSRRTTVPRVRALGCLIYIFVIF